MKPGAAAFVSVLAIGCGRVGPELPAVRWESAHFRYAAYPDDGQACAQMTGLLEQHWAFWHERLGLPDPGSAPILYAKDRGYQELLDDGWCPGTSAGCTTGTDVRTYVLFDRHELIHAYLGETMAPPVPLFAEGMAVAFSCDSGGAFPLPGKSWRQLLDPAPDSPDGFTLYAAGGQLVSYLFKQFGADPLVRFYGRIGALSDPDAIAAEFAAAFGTSLDDAWALATASNGPFCLSLWECTREAIPLDGAPHAGTLVCGVDLVPRTLRVDAATNVTASVRDAAASVYLDAACGDASALGTSMLPAGDYQLLAGLSAGTYLVRGATAEITASALDAPSVGSSCDALTPYPVAPGLPLVVTAAAPTAVARVRFADAARTGVLSDDLIVSTRTYIWSCPDCATDANSCPAATDAGLQASFLGDYVWRMSTTAGWATAHLDAPP
ncbi:MAG TPA: hypothetical protein VIF57_24755 [Polyangia bacterium]|jgi:hypothetical protein